MSFQINRKKLIIPILSVKNERSVLCVCTTFCTGLGGFSQFSVCVHFLDPSLLMYPYNYDLINFAPILISIDIILLYIHCVSLEV